MDHNFLHIFRLIVEGIPEPIEFEMFHESDDVADVMDAFSKYVARQEDNFLPLGTTGAIRADRVVRIDHLRCESLKSN